MAVKVATRFVFVWSRRWVRRWGVDAFDDDLAAGCFAVHPSNVTSSHLTSHAMHYAFINISYLGMKEWSQTPCESYFWEPCKDSSRINNVCISGCLPIYSFAFNEWPEDEHESIVSVAVSLEHTRRLRCHRHLHTATWRNTYLAKEWQVELLAICIHHMLTGLTYRR